MTEHEILILMALEGVPQVGAEIGGEIADLPSGPDQTTRISGAMEHSERSHASSQSILVVPSGSVAHSADPNSGDCRHGGPKDATLGQRLRGREE